MNVKTTMPRADSKVRVPRELNGWSLYEISDSPSAILIYGHEDGGWAVIRPFQGGPEVLVFEEHGELTQDAIDSLNSILKFALTGTKGLAVDVPSITNIGGVAEAYDEAGFA